MTKSDNESWANTKWAYIIDKLVIAILVVIATASVNYWFDLRRSELSSRTATAELAKSKGYEIWETIGKYRNSLDKINNLKRAEDISKTFKVGNLSKLRSEINEETVKSKKLKYEVQEKINMARSYVGKPITEDATMYAQLLEGYYSQLDRLMFGQWPKNFDRSHQFEELGKTREFLYKMEMNPIAFQKYVESNFIK